MPGLQFQNLPAAQVNEIIGKLRSQWQIEARALSVKPFKSQEQADAELAKLNAKYQRFEFDSLTQLQQQQQEQERVQQLIKQPRERTRAEEAQLRMELPAEAERLVFPPEAVMRPLSLSQLRAREPGEKITKIEASIDEYVDTAPTISKPWTFERNEPKTKQGLIDRYLEWRRYIGYEGLNPLVQRQYDHEWDSWLSKDNRYDEWWPDKKKQRPLEDVNVEIRALRTPGKFGKMMRGRITGAEGITPVGRSVIKEKPRGRGLPFAQPRIPTRKQEQAPIKQRNRRTGQERISYNGGKTWQMIG